MAIKFKEGLEGLRQISLFELRADLFPNARDESGNRTAITELRDNIANQGLLHPLVVGRLPDGKEGLMAGFSRRLAILQLAVTSIFTDVNKSNGKTKKTDEGYLDVADAEHRKKVQELRPQEWEKALRETLVPVTVKEVKNAQEAAIINFGENVIRNDFTPLELVKQIVKMTSGPDGIKAKTLAAQMGVSEGKISQWRKVGEGGEYMRTAFITPEEGETLSEQEMADLKNTVKQCVDDFEYRLGLTKPDPRAIEFTDARTLIYYVMNPKKKPSRKNALRALQHMLGWQESGGLVENRRTAELTTWTQLVEADAKMEKAAANATATTEEVAEEVSGEEATAETPVSEASATTQGSAAAAAANAATPATDGTTATPAPAAAAGATSTAGGTGGTQEGAAVPVDNAPPSKRTTKAGQEMPESKKYAAAWTHDKVEGQADFNVETAGEGNLRFSEPVGYLYAASAAYEALGLEGKQKAVDMAVDELVDAQEDYIGKLELIAKAVKSAGMPIKGVNLKELIDDDGNMIRPVVDVGGDDDDEIALGEETEGEVVGAAAAVATA